MTQSRSIKAIILASGQTLTALVGIVSAAVLSRLFNQDDYATYRATLLAYTFAAPFVVLGLHQALYYFLPNEKERTRGVLVENLTLLVIGGLVLTLFLLFGGNYLLARRFNNPALVTTLLILAPYPLLIIPTSAISACLMARDQAAQVAKYNVASRIIMLLAVVVPCLIFPNPTTAIIGVVVGASITSVTAITLMLRACNAGPWRPTLQGMRSQFNFSVPLGLSTMASTVSRSLDQVFVAALCTPATFAVFVNGAMPIPLISIVTGSVTSVLIVDYAKLYKEGKTEEIVALIHRAMVKCALILIPAMAFLLCMAPELMRFIYGARYEGSADPFRIYLLLLPIRTLTFGAILMATGHSRLLLYQTILSLTVKVSLVWFAVSYFGAIGAAATSVVVVYSVTIPYLLVAIRKILQQPINRLFPWRDLLKVGVASFAPATVVIGLQHVLAVPDVVALSINGTVYVALTLAMFSWFGFVSIPALFEQLTSRLRR